MASFDENDDDPDFFPHSSEPGFSEDEEFAGTPHDDMTTVQCVRCRKWMFEDAPQCPYCKHWQPDPLQARKPLWFIVTAILCIGMVGGFSMLALLGKIPWLFR